MKYTNKQIETKLFEEAKKIVPKFETQVRLNEIVQRGQMEQIKQLSFFKKKSFKWALSFSCVCIISASLIIPLALNSLRSEETLPKIGEQLIEESLVSTIEINSLYQRSFSSNNSLALNTVVNNPRFFFIVEKGKVTSYRGLNKEAQVIVNNETIIGKTFIDATNLIFDLSLKTGYIKKEATSAFPNEVFAYISCLDANKEVEVKKSFSLTTKKYFQENHIFGAIKKLNIFQADDYVAAEKYGVSVEKYLLLKELAETNENLHTLDEYINKHKNKSIEQLCKMLEKANETSNKYLEEEILNQLNDKLNVIRQEYYKYDDVLEEQLGLIYDNLDEIKNFNRNCGTEEIDFWSFDEDDLPEFDVEFSSNDNRWDRRERRTCSDDDKEELTKLRGEVKLLVEQFNIDYALQQEIHQEFSKRIEQTIKEYDSSMGEKLEEIKKGFSDLKDEMIEKNGHNNHPLPPDWDKNFNRDFEDFYHGHSDFDDFFD